MVVMNIELIFEILDFSVEEKDNVRQFLEDYPDKEIKIRNGGAADYNAKKLFTD